MSTPRRCDAPSVAGRMLTQRRKDAEKTGDDLRLRTLCARENNWIRDLMRAIPALFSLRLCVSHQFPLPTPACKQ